MQDPQGRDEQQGGGQVIGEAVIRGEAGPVGGDPALGGVRGQGRMEGEIDQPDN